MNTAVEMKTYRLDGEHLQAREQYVAQVHDESLVATRVLEEQLQASEPRGTAPTFVP